MAKVVAICGMAGSGKSEVSQMFENSGFIRMHLGVTEMAMEKFGKTSEEIESRLRVEVREKFGMAAMVLIKMDVIKELYNNDQNIVIDNMYSWSEYKVLKEQFKDDFISIAIHASPKTRYNRLAQRSDGRDYSDISLSQKRDYSEIEKVEKGGPIAMADYHIVNENITLEELKTKTEQIINNLKS